MLKTALENRIIEKFKFYWRYMVEARQENDQDRVLFCYHHLSAIIDLISYIYPKIDILMIDNQASRFAYNMQNVIIIKSYEYHDDDPIELGE